MYFLQKRLQVFLISIVVLLIAHCQGVLFDRNIVHTKYGSLQGTYQMVGNTKVYQFLKIPYAKAPVGSLRFKKPVAHPVWHGVRDATKYGPVCVQKVTKSYRNIYPNYDTSEDCLFLNIYVPNGVKHGKKAVLLYIHGGGFFSKSANLYDGSDLAADGDVIVVLVNYRLGLLGFLSTRDSAALGNFGLWDQLAAMKWVKENIADFGGDSSNITIAGHSAGGYSIGLHLLSNHSTGLYNRAIMMSGFGLSPRAISHQARAFTNGAARYIGCPTSNSTNLITCMRSRKASDILRAQLHQVSHQGTNLSFYLSPGPVIDGDFLKGNPSSLIQNGNNGPFKDVGLMLGTNNADGWLLKSKLLHFESSYNFSLNDGVPPSVFCNEIIKAIIRDYFQSNKNISQKICEKYSSPSMNKLNQGLNAIDMYGDMMYAAPEVQTLRYHSQTGNNPRSYQFLFHHKPSFPVISSRTSWVLGAQHGDECWFIFKMKNFHYTKQEIHLLQQFGRYLTNFVKYGNPNGKTNHADNAFVPHWSHFTPNREYYMDINTNMTLLEHLFSKRIAFWLNDVPLLHSSAIVPTKVKIPYVFG
ncbi:hypothetical protein FSP39_021177 [Pinctada imbricata]|uniref:Carboxylic ester hydrolase n=1 Tax=Pinctada imbricata TaxID=66713 RepID=A0AA88YL54_PINIB|nr:hypothetical protein FSP39_021177 [Pinctada imbricata]